MTESSTINAVPEAAFDESASQEVVSENENIVPIPTDKTDVSSPHTGGIKNEKRKGKKRRPKKAAKRGSGRPASHGMSNSAEYRAFYAARSRCENPNFRQYADYGGRGIKFLFDCFEEFFDEVGPRPSPDHSLDRIDTDGHYEKGNLRWASRKVQAKNRRSTKKYKAEAAKRKITWQQAARLHGNQLSRLWNLTIRYHNENELPPVDKAEWEALVSGMPFDLLRPIYPNPTEGQVILPSLTKPGETVRLNCRQTEDVPEYGLGDRGLLDAVSKTPLEENVPGDLLDLLIRCVDGVEPSERFLWFTPPTGMGIKTLAIEGCLLAFASFYAACFTDTEHLYPQGTFQTARELVGLAAIDHLDALPPNLLIVPDLQVGLDPEGTIPHNLTYAVHDMLTQRVQTLCPTIVFVDNPQLLGERIATLLEFNFRKVPLDLLTGVYRSGTASISRKPDLPDLSNEL